MGCVGEGGNGIEVQTERMRTGYPAGTGRRNDVVLASLRHQYDCDVSTTSFRRDIPTGYLLLLAHKSVLPT